MDGDKAIQIAITLPNIFWGEVEVFRSPVMIREDRLEQLEFGPTVHLQET